MCVHDISVTHRIRCQNKYARCGVDMCLKSLTKVTVTFCSAMQTCILATKPQRGIATINETKTSHQNQVTHSLLKKSNYMDYYDKENSRNSLSRRESTVKPFSRSTHGGYIANRQQWLESGSAGRPNPGKYTNRRASISSKGVIAQRMKWVEEQSQKGPMVAASTLRG